MKSVWHIAARRWIGAVVAAGWAGSAGAVWAQVQPITSATVTYQTAANTNANYTTTGGGSTYFPTSTVYNVRFSEGTSNRMYLGTVTVGGRTFDGVALAGDINIARATNAPIKGIHHIVLYQQQTNSGTNVFLKSPYAATMEESLRSPLVNHGADNVFSDQGDANGNNNNIQRIDYLFSDGLPVHSHVEQRGFLVMDRGGNDRFKIAAVTALDGNGNPTAFGTPVSVMETNWGASGLTLDTIVMRGYTESGDPQHPSADVDPQPLSGVFLSWQALGLKTNDLFYGYALVANDTTTNGAYWTQIDNAAYFPTNTSPDSTYGGLDLISGGLMFYDEALNVTFGDRAWEDLDADGLQDAGEPGITNVLVYVYDAASNLAAVVRTDTNGVWKSTGHGVGSYFAKFFLPSGYERSARYVGTNAAIDSDADLVTGLTAVFAMTNGQTNLTLDAGMYRRAALGDFVWEDLDGDGQQDGGEPGLPNVVVRLFNAASNVIGTTTSSAAGAYVFTNLMPGTSYFVDFAPPAGYLFTTSNVGADATDSDPLPGTNRTALVSLVSGQTNLTVDAGFYRLAALGDFVWNDLDGDGQQDGGEPALAGVPVRLYDAASNVVGATTSSAVGAYALTNLPPGTYFVEFAAPSGFFGAPANVGDDATDSDADPATGRTAPFVLPSGQNDSTVDAGFGQPVSLGDTTWIDSNFNGQQDAGEPALSNVVVRLYNAVSNVVGTKTSTAAGAYAFTNLPPGTYFVGFTPPPGYQLTAADLGDDATDSDPDPMTRLTAAIVLAGGENNPTLDAGFVFPAALGDYVWTDSNYNGQQDVGEPALANVVVTLYDAASIVVGTKTSTAAGAYAFTNLPPGTYYVGFAPPAGYLFTTANVGADATDSDVDPTLGHTAPFALTNGQTDLTIDAGFFNSAGVSLKLFKSRSLTNAWELGQTNEYYLTVKNTGTVALAGVALTDVLPPGVSFVPGSAQIVRMTTVATNPFVETVSDGFGTAAYANNDGSANWVGSWAEVGDNANPASGSVLVRVAGATNALVFEGTSADNDYVTRTNPLAPMAGRTYTNLTLSFGYRRQSWDTGDSFTFYVSTNGFVGQSNLVFAVPTTSGSDASYVQITTNLTSRMGANVALRLRAGGSFSTGDQINFDFVTFTNSGIDVVTNVETAYGPGVTVSVVSDLPSATPTNLLANFTMAAGTTVTVRIRATLGAPLASTQLVNLAMATNPVTPPLTATATNYVVHNTVGDRAWLDVDADGIQDAGEPGLAGATVRLYGGNSNLLAATTTGADGAYGFSILPTGSYFLEFVPPADHRITLQDQGGADALDSDVHTNSGRTVVFALSGGTNDVSRDAGFFRVAALGDHTWEDVDRDGQQDAGEPALANVVVTLYNAASNAIGTVTSSASGAYAFTNLVPGTYFAGFAAPAGYWYTAANAGDDATDSDAVPTTGVTAPVTLASGETNGTVDAGFFQAAGIGDRIWFDEDRDGIQDATETNGIPLIPVALLDTNGNVVAETVTGTDGKYLFANMPTGTYAVRFDLASLTTNQALSPFNVGSDDAVDSDSISGNVTDYAWTAPYSVSGGTTNLTIDLGITVRGSFRAAVVETWGEWADGEGRVAWRTESEYCMAGFHVYRVDPETGAETRVNERLVFSALREDGATYAVADAAADAGATGTYRLEEVEQTGERRDLGTHEIRFGELRRGAKPSVSARPAARFQARAASRARPGPSPVQKVRVRRDGIYGVELAALAAGMDLPVATVQALAASNGLAVAKRGAPVPWIYDAAGERLLFRGEEPPPNWYVHDASYLIQAGPGLAMPRRAPGATGGQTAFPTRLRFEKDDFLFSMVRMPADFYFWLPVQYGWTNDVSLDLSGYAGGDLTLKVRFMGYLNSTNSAAHLARFWFNGAPAGSYEFNGQQELETELAIPAGNVSNGVNVLSIDEGAPDGAFVVDWIEASFNRNLAPRAAPAEFFPGAAAAVSAADFDDPLALALDAAGRPTWMADENGQLPDKAWAVSAGDERFVVVDEDEISTLAPESAAAEAWFMAETNQIDYLVIASRTLAPAAQELADYRAGQGLRAGVAVFEDACDLLTGGEITPEAIPALLRHAAATWAKSPAMVVLAGNGHYDYLGANSSEANHLPPLLVQTPAGVCASDGRLADTGGDSLPDVAIGRLPAKTPEQLAAMIDKIQAYEAGFGAAWQNQISLAADAADSVGDFSAENDQLAALATDPYSVAARIDLDTIGIGEARTNLLCWFNVGVGFIHFTGHGDMSNLGKSNLLTSAKVASMTNALRPPILVSLTCLAARYEYPSASSLGELLLQRAGGGAVAVLGPSGLSRNGPASELGQAFYTAIFQEGVGRLGMTFLRARRSLPGSVFADGTYAVYNLLGDPALRIAGNPADNPAGTAAQIVLSGLFQTYDGRPRAVTADTVPAGLTVKITYDGSSVPPTDAGSYAVVASSATADSEGSATGLLVVAKAPAAVTLSGLAQVYDGNARAVMAITEPAGLDTIVTYIGLPAPPQEPGSYEVVAAVADANHEGAATGTLVVAKALATVMLDDLAQVFDGTGRTVTAATDPPNLPVTVTYNGSPEPPVNAGTYAVNAAIDDARFAGKATDTLVVAKAPAQVQLGNLQQVYDGTRKYATAQTLPDELAVDFLYDGSPVVPRNAGSYAVAAAVSDANWQGTAAGILTVGKGRQTISFPPVGDRLATEVVNLSARASSGLPVAFAVVAGPAQISGGNSLSFTGVGEVTVVASQAGDANWEAAPVVAKTFHVGALMISAANVNVREDGAGRFFLRLAVAPASNTVFAVSRIAGAPGLTVQGGAVRTFTPANWSNWQAVVLAAAADDNAEGETATFRISSPGLPDRFLTATTLDDDIGENLALAAGGTTIAGMKASRPELLIDGVHNTSTNYGHTGWTYVPPGTMTLDLQHPTAIQRMRLLTWNWTHRVHHYQIEGSVDGVEWIPLVDASEGDHSGWEDWEVTGSPVRYLRFTGLYCSALQSVMVPEWEVYGERARPPQPEIDAARVNVREGGDGRFFVRLASPPAENIVFTVSRASGDAGLIIRAGATRVFTPANWNTWQAVTLAAAPDDNAVGETAVFQVSAPGWADQFVMATALDDDIGENLALASAGATITGMKASRPELVIDGIHLSSGNYGHTGWTNEPPGTMTLDLKRTAALARVRLLNWDWLYRVHRYRIEASLDGKAWSLLADASGEDRHGWNDWSAGGRLARYLRFTGLSNSVNQSVVIAELEVYGEPVAARRNLPDGTAEVRTFAKAATTAALFPVTVVTGDDGPDHTNGWAAVDGDLETAWVGAQGAGGWYIALEYDLPLVLSNLLIEVMEGSVTEYQGLYSENAEDWQPLPGELDTHPVSLNFLWLVFPDNGTEAVPQVIEIQPNP